MKQKLKRFMAGFMAMLTLVGTLFTNGTTCKEKVFKVSSNRSWLY